MKISKHLHSCLLIEHQGKTILLDPGNYTHNEQALSIASLASLDFIGITHEHEDHMYIPTLKQLVQTFPKVQIFSTTAVQEILKKEAISVMTEGNEFITLEDSPHEKTFFGKPPANVMITLFNTITHVGDSLSFSHAADILALPIQAPWGSTTWAVQKAMEIKPKVIIPIHDYHWRDEIRLWIYDRLEKYFEQQNILFKKPETNQVFEV